MSARLEPMTEPTQAGPAGARQSPQRRRSNGPRWRRWLLILGVPLVLIVGWVLVAANQPAGPAPSVTPTVAAGVTARGRVEPIAQARVLTLTGGVITRLAVVAGETVADQQEIARVRGASGAVEVLTAPWAGTITSLPVNQGDSVLVGALVATIGDLSRLQVETTDVDEFLIGRLSRGQPVTVIIDAVDRREMAGVVQRIALVPRAGTGGDEHYPVTIALAGATDDLRPGMTVRLRFA